MAASWTWIWVETISMLDAAICEVARREDRTLARRYKKDDIVKLSDRERLQIVCKLRTEWAALKPKWHEAGALVSGNELSHRAKRTAATGRAATAERYEKSSQAMISGHVMWEGLLVPRVQIGWRPSPGHFVQPFSNDHFKFLATASEAAIGGKDKLLRVGKEVIELGFAFEALDDLTKCGWFDSINVDGCTNGARACRIGTCGWDCWTDLIDVMAIAATEHYDEKAGKFDWGLCDQPDEDGAWCRIGKRMLVLEKVGLVQFDKKEKTWVPWGPVWKKLYAAFAARAKAHEEAGTLVGATVLLKEPESVPTLATLMVAYFAMYIRHEGKLDVSVYCKYGVEAVARAKGGEKFAVAALEERAAFIRERNAALASYKAGEKGLVDVLVQARGPQARPDEKDRFYTKVFEVKMLAWAFESTTGARRLLKGESQLKAFIYVAASAVVTGPDRVNPANVANFLSLKDGTSCVLFGCDVRWSFDGGRTWIDSGAKWYKLGVGDVVFSDE